MRNRKRVLPPLLCLGLAFTLLGTFCLSGNVAASANDKNVKKERQAVRRMQQQLNEMQQQKSLLDQEKAALEETLKKAGDETESHKKSAASAAARASRLEKDIEAANREKVELNAQLAEAQKQNRELDGRRKQLEQDLKNKAAALAKEGEQRNLCEANNVELYHIGRELVDWYTKKGPLNAILEATMVRLATVAGMGVAIPSLFGYNYLASRIKAIVSRMHIFVDEFITKLAENYSR